MTAAHPTLPKGNRLPAPPLGTLEQVLIGPAVDAGGRTNLVGALRAAMGLCGYESLKDFQKAELVTTRS
jgi:IMP dehydrogenase